MTINPPPPPIQPPAANPAPPVATSSIDWPKELVSALMAIAIVGLTLVLLAYMFFDPAGADSSNKTLWEHRSGVIQTCLALAGTVTGYYYGRIPAERAAASATQASAANAARADDAKVSKDQMVGQLKDLRTQLQTGNSPMGGGSVLTATPEDVRAAVSRRIEQIIGGG